MLQRGFVFVPPLSWEVQDLKARLAADGRKGLDPLPADPVLTPPA